MRLLETTENSYKIDRDGTVYELPRVTSPLSLVQRFDGIPAGALAHAAERGKAVHRAIWILEADPSGLEWSTVHPEVQPYVEAWLAFKALTGLRVVAAEQFVVSWRYGVAGRADLLVEGLSNRLDVLDLKTGAEHPAHHLQGSGYLELYRETTGTKRALGRQILYLNPNGTTRLVSPKPEDHQKDFNTFLACVAVYRWSRDHDRT